MMTPRTPGNGPGLHRFSQVAFSLRVQILALCIAFVLSLLAGYLVSTRLLDAPAPAATAASVPDRA
jgi:hypothetical protein